MIPSWLLEHCWKAFVDLWWTKILFFESFKTATPSNSEAPMEISEPQTTGSQILGSLIDWDRENRGLITYVHLLNNEEQIQDLFKNVISWRKSLLIKLVLRFRCPLNNIKYNYYNTSSLEIELSFATILFHYRCQ